MLTSRIAISCIVLLLDGHKDDRGEELISTQCFPVLLGYSASLLQSAILANALSSSLTQLRIHYWHTHLSLKLLLVQCRFFFYQFAAEKRTNDPLRVSVFSRKLMQGAVDVVCRGFVRLLTVFMDHMHPLNPL